MILKIFETSFYLIPLSFLMREHWGSKVLMIHFLLGLICLRKKLKLSFLTVLKMNWYRANLVFLTIGIISLTYSSNYQNGMNRLTFSFLLMIFPVFHESFARLNSNSNHENRIFKFYSVSVYVYCIIIIIKLMIIYMVRECSLQELINNYGYLNFKNIYKFSEVNSMYFSMMLCFAFSIVLFYSKRIESMKLKIACYSLTITITLVILILVDSKIAYVSFGLINLVFIYSLNLSRTTRFISITTIVGLLLSFILFMPSNRVKKFIDVGDNTRLNNYSSSIETIKDNFLFGVGYGDELAELQKKRRQADNVDNYIVKMKFNAHNQYLESFVGVGFVGVVFFIFMMLFFLIEAIRGNNPLFISFLFLINLFFLIESVLVRHYGIIFCSYFLSIFLIYMNKEKRLY